MEGFNLGRGILELKAWRIETLRPGKCKLGRWKPGGCQPGGCLSGGRKPGMLKSRGERMKDGDLEVGPWRLEA